MKTKLREVRKAQNMTQRELADLCHVSNRTIISIEKGDSNPCLMLAYKLSQVLDVDMETLFCLSENVKDFRGEDTARQEAE